MSKIDENGNIQYCKITLRDTIRAHVKANFIRFLANVYGAWWYLGKLWRDGD